MNWKKIGRRLLFPPVWLILLLTVLSAAVLIYVFINNLNETALSYAAYIAAFYTLVAVCAFLARTLPGRYRQAKQAVYGNPLGNRYLTDVEFKNRVSLYCSLAVNLLYAGMNGVSAFLYHSAWFGIFAGYYMILAVMRFLLVRYFHRDRLRRSRLTELRRARVCAGILATVSLVLAGAVPMILYQGRGFEYHGTLIYAMALYVFYITISAVSELIRYRKYNSPILFVSKAVKTAAALVSMLALETAMFSQFGGNPEEQRAMIMATGAGISLVITAMAVSTCIRSTREIKKIRRQDCNGEQSEAGEASGNE